MPLRNESNRIEIEFCLFQINADVNECKQMKTTVKRIKTNNKRVVDGRRVEMDDKRVETSMVRSANDQ